MDTGAEVPAMSEEQAADLARLQAMAGEGQQGQPGEGPGPDQAAGVDPVESLAGFLSLAGMALGVIGYRRTAEVWKPEACRGLAERAVPVLVKYPWGQRAMEFLTTGAGVEEIALGVYVAPLALATYQAARADVADMEAARKAAAEARRRPAADPEPVPAGETIEGQAWPG